MEVVLDGIVGSQAPLEEVVAEVRNHPERSLVAEAVEEVRVAHRLPGVQHLPASAVAPYPASSVATDYPPDHHSHSHRTNCAWAEQAAVLEGKPAGEETSCADQTLVRTPAAAVLFVPAAGPYGAVVVGRIPDHRTPGCRSRRIVGL